MKDKLYILVYKLLVAHDIYLDKEELIMQIESHPSYPSLHAITGVLSHFGVSNAAIEVPVTPEIITELPKHFIAHITMSEEQEDFVLVTLKKDKVILYTTANKKEEITTEKFLSRWKGILVLVEKEESLDNVNHKPNAMKNYVMVLFAGILSYALGTSALFNWLTAAYLVLAAAGLYISYLLLQHELGINSQVVNDVCTSSEKTSCDAVLHSKGATILGFKMSDIAMVFFMTLVVVTAAFIVINNSFLYRLIALSVLSIPMLAYSLYYQKIVVKKWCPLCLGIVAVLCCQVVLALWVNPLTFQFDVAGFLFLLASTLAVAFSYGMLKTLVVKKLELAKSNLEHHKFKRDFSIFETLYQKGARRNMQLADTTELVLGNPQAKLQLTLITSPTCGFCKAKHQQAAQLLTNKTLDLGLRIRFNISTANKANPAYQIANILLKLYAMEDIKLCLQAMDEIYAKDSNMGQWLEKYKNYQNEDFDKDIANASNWCQEQGINFTPAVYLNGQEFPKAYALSDLALFEEELEALEIKPYKPSILV